MDVSAGGEAPCRALELGDDVVVDLDTIAGESESSTDRADGADGVVWSLPHGGDLDANLVRLGSGGSIGAHVNDEVDVLMVVRAGSGEVTIDEIRHAVRAGAAVSIRRGARRSIAASPAGLEYLSIHRRRGLLDIGRRP